MKYKQVRKILDDWHNATKYKEDLLKKVADPNVHDDIVKAARMVAKTMGWGCTFEQALPLVEKGDFTTYKKESRNVLSTFKSLLRYDVAGCYIVAVYNTASKAAGFTLLGDVSNTHIILTKKVLKKAIKLYNKLCKKSGLSEIPCSKDAQKEIFDLCKTKKKEQQLISAVIATIHTFKEN